MGNLTGVQKVAAGKIGISLEEYLSRIVNEKWCAKCKAWKERLGFGIDNSRSDKLSSKCLECVRVKIKVSTKGRPSSFKGKKHTEETRKIISQKVKSANLPPPMLNKKHTLETRQKISSILREKAARGENCHSYKDGKSEERTGLRRTKEYKRWRFDVFTRDKFTCQKCGDNTGGNLNAHHVKHFATHPELRFNIDNGITLCETCHKLEH